MSEEELRTLVRQALLEILGPQRCRALVLFTGGLLGFEDAITELKALRDAGVELDCVQTQSAQRILDQDLIASVGMREVSKDLVAKHHMLIAPTLTGNIAAKVAHGVADCLASNLFGEFIMTNRLVVVSRSAVCPDSAPKKAWFPEMPEGYAKMLRTNLAALDSFGVKVVDARVLCRVALAAWQRQEEKRRSPLIAALGTSYAAFAARFADQAPPATQPVASTPVGGTAPTVPGRADSRVVPCSQPLISQQVIGRLPDGTELRISHSAKVTAMARDMAAARSIRITREV